MSKRLIVTRWYPTDENPIHGVFVREFVKATAVFNDVVILFGELLENYSSKRLYEIKDDFDGNIRTIRFKYRSRPFRIHRIINLIGFMHCLLKLKREKYRPDIIHFHEYLASLPVLVYSRIFRIPLVITEHYTGFVRGVLSRSEKFMARFILKQADIVLPVSEYLKNALLPYAPKTRYEIVPNIVDCSLFSQSKVNKKADWETKQMIMVGRLDPAKGISFLLEALHKLKKKRTDFFLHIVGDGTIKEELTRLCDELDLERHVRFHGRKPKHVMAKMMSESDFFVLPSLFETFGCVVIEAMACGKPVITTDIGGPNGIVTRQTGILVKPADSEALENGINFMLDSYFTYSNEKIIEYAKSNFSVSVIGQRLDDIYKTLMPEG